MTQKINTRSFIFDVKGKNILNPREKKMISGFGDRDFKRENKTTNFFRAT